MPYTRPRITRPLPRAAGRRVPWRATKPAPGLTAPFSTQLGGWNFAARIYVAWDSANSPTPQWIEVTQFVDLEAAITITRGRPDGESAPQVGTCTLTVDNSDGRWSPANPNGAWFGQIRKGCWLRVDLIPPSQTVSTRFVGFVQQLPVSWQGQYAQTQISASDRFVLLGSAPNLQTAIACAWLSDPVAGRSIAGYWPLHEATGSISVADISGQAPAGQTTLALASQNANAGAGVSFANDPAPGWDGADTIAFAPTGTAIPYTGGGSSGALLNGSYLRGNIGPVTGTQFSVSVFVQTTVANQPIWSWSAPGLNYAIGMGLDPSGYVQLWQGPITPSYAGVTSAELIGYAQAPINDGNWHEISLTVQPGAGRGYVLYAIAVDGVMQFFQFAPDLGYGIVISPPTSLSQLTVGGAAGWPYGTYTGVGLFTGQLSDLVVHQLSLPTFPFGGPLTSAFPNFYGAWQAATAMWQSPNSAYAVPESCGRRVIRLASYAGVPAATETFTEFFLSGFYQLNGADITPGTSAFISIPAETAHPAGYQQTLGQQPLTCMQAAAATENMPLFVDRQGRITLQPSTLRQNPSAAFTINALDLDPSTMWADDFQYLQNQTIVTSAGAGSLTVNTNGAASQALQGVYSDSVTAITINSAESTSLGAAVNANGANPQPRHAPLACEVATLATQTGYGAAWYDAVLAAEISTVIGVTNWPTQSASASSGSYYIEGYTETISGGNHLFAWNTSPAQGATYQCDSATLGLVDTPGITLAY